MSAYNFVTGQDLANAILKSGGQNQATTDDYYLDVQMALMQEYKSILAYGQWYWAKKPLPGIITTTARQLVTVSSISGNQVTLSATVTPSVQYQKFYINANQAYYRITAHTAGTAVLTLDATYVETTRAGQATLYQDEYNLASDCLVPWTPFRIRGQWERDVEVVSEKEGRARYGWSTTTAISVPEVAWVVRTDPAGGQNVRVQIAPWPTDAMNLEYDYTVNPADLTFDGNSTTDVPLIPQPYRWVLYQRALSQLFATKNDDLSERAWLRAQQGLDEMTTKYLDIASETRYFTRPRYGLGVS